MKNKFTKEERKNISFVLNKGGVDAFNHGIEAFEDRDPRIAEYVALAHKVERMREDISLELDLDEFY